MACEKDWQRPLDCPKCGSEKTFQEGFCSKCNYDVTHNNEDDLLAVFKVKITSKGIVKRHEIFAEGNDNKRLYRDILIAEVSHQLRHLIKQKDDEDDLEAELRL